MVRTLPRLRASLAALAALLPFAVAVRAEPSPAPYIERRWLVDDGLPHNLVNRTVQDGAGYLWLATGTGLARFDGCDFNLLRLPMASARGSYNIRDLVAEGPDSLLMLPAEGGVVRYRAGVFSFHPASTAVTGLSLIDLFVEPNGTLWLGAGDGTLIRWEAGRTTTFGPKDGLNRRGNRFTFALDADGILWIAGGDFLGCYLDGHLQRLADPVGTSVIIAPARSGGVWVSTYERLLKLEHGRLGTVVEGANWPVARSSVHYLFEDHTNTLWIATRRHGLFRYSGGVMAPVTGLTPQITAVTEDREGNIWASTDGGGLARLKPKAFTLLDRSTGLTEDVSMSVCADAHGALWCANQNGGLVRYAVGRPEVIAISPATAEFFAVAVCPDRNGHVWVGAAGGLFRVPTTPPYTVEKISPALRAARVLWCARDGDMWVGASDGGLGFFHQGAAYRELLRPEAVGRSFVTAISEAPDGSIWVGFGNGTLLHWRDGALDTVTDGAGATAAARINALYFDRGGDLWIATMRGLQLRHDGRTRIFTTADGLPDDEIDNLLEDDAGRFWLCSRSGFSQVAIADLRARFADSRPPLVPAKFGRDEGLAGASSSNFGQPRVWKTTDGRLWFTTHRGIIGLEPSALSQRRTPPPVYIDEVRIDGRPTAATGGAITVPAGRHRVDFHFVALNFSAPDKVRVRHRLAGIDLDWIETTSEHNATYARLPPGRYQMTAIACNQDGLWNTAGTSLTIVVAAAWWETAWFITALLVGFTGLVVWSVRSWSHRRLKRRLAQLEHENLLERERARIARDLHDELGGSLTQIRLLVERIKRHAGQPEFRDFAGQLAWRVRRLGGELESIIWTVSPKNNTCDRLASFIGQYALKFFRDTSMVCTVDGMEQVPALPLRPDEQHSLLAIAKEAMNNALKHSQATRVNVTLAGARGVFSLCISDDGVGFDPAASNLAACNGLNNMRARLREIGGECSIVSAPGAGTTITVTHRMGEDPPPGAHLRHSAATPPTI